MSVEFESARRLTALKNKIDTATSTTSSTLSEAVDNVIAGFGQGGGGDSVETCTVEVVLPAAVAMFGYGDYDVYVQGSYSKSSSMPATYSAEIYPTTRIFNNLPVGTVFTFYGGGTSKNINIRVTGDIESFVTCEGTSSMYPSRYAVCRCNGSGTVTIS